MAKPRKKFSLCSTAYDKRGNILSVGINDYRKSNPWQKALSLQAGMSEHRIHLHSEVACLLKAKGKKVHTLLVERYDTEGNPRLAFPCPSCQLAIKQAGVKKVLFTTEEEIKSWIV